MKTLEKKTHRYLLLSLDLLRPYRLAPLLVDLSRLPRLAYDAGRSGVRKGESEFSQVQLTQAHLASWYVCRGSIDQHLKYKQQPVLHIASYESDEAYKELTNIYAQRENFDIFKYVSVGNSYQE